MGIARREMNEVLAGPLALTSVLYIVQYLMCAACMCIYIYTHIHIHVDTHTCIHALMHSYMYAYIHVLPRLCNSRITFKTCIYSLNMTPSIDCCRVGGGAVPNIHVSIYIYFFFCIHLHTHICTKSPALRCSSKTQEVAEQLNFLLGRGRLFSS